MLERRLGQNATFMVPITMVDIHIQSENEENILTVNQTSQTKEILHSFSPLHPTCVYKKSRQ